MVINNSKILICLAYLPSLFSITFLYSAVVHIYSLGKSKTFRKKERQKRRWVQKIFLLGHVASCKHHAVAAKWLRSLYWVELVLVCLCAILCCFLSNNIVSLLFQYCVCVKVIVIDIPVNVYCMAMTKRAKNGGVTWRWDN